MNYIGLILLGVAFVFSLADVLTLDREEGAKVETDRVVRVLHWQLEPGFREALDAVIEDYNALPHVKAAGYRVEQMAVTERVYDQFLNVHLISGTAPDLAAFGAKQGGNTRARYFEPFLDVLEKPNPYNSEGYLPEDIDPDFKAFVQDSPWKETFLNGLQSSLNRDLGYYYSIPIASWGTVRMYFNRDLLREVKTLTREALLSPEPPKWIQTVLAAKDVDGSLSYVDDSPELREWTLTDEPPRSYGQLILICEATREYARKHNREKLVPISGSYYSRDFFANAYNAALFYAWEDRLDVDKDSSFSALEWFRGFDQGIWDFNDPRMRAYYGLQVKLASYFPVGFLGLDREQANRRFVLGNALFLVTGAWDAAGIFASIQAGGSDSRSFEVGVSRFVLPRGSEKWASLNPRPASEVGWMDGVPLGLYKYSSLKSEAVDFLHYVTSLQPNRKLVQKAGWMPIVAGIEPVDRMKPFLPVVEGVRGSFRLQLTGGNLETLYEGQYLLHMSGDIDYPTFVDRVTTLMKDPVNGTDRQWYEQFRRTQETVRGVERSLSLQRYNHLVAGSLDRDIDLYEQVLTRSSDGISGLAVKRDWKRFGYKRPFPDSDP
jgi:hypothetical protein